jgi:arylsulfatase A-like enzyme
MLIDDLGYGDTGHTGAEYATPTIDALALDGIRLNQSCVVHLCSSTRAALLTSRYSYSIGMDGNVLTDGASHCAPLNVSTVGDQMQKQAKAATAFIGKYGLKKSKEAACVRRWRGLEISGCARCAFAHPMMPFPRRLVRGRRGEAGGATIVRCGRL